ncbi:MAG: hypothetical protein IIY21_00955 [Clostridiales bacterium]|nr:hypothetical protein [Clostridiales bacterium]MBQ1571460.1 hypothetical protein [Clostridiales bacterium]
MTNSKQKGKRGELEVARILREHGFTEARRTAQFCGNTGQADDVIGLDGFHIEVKRCETTKIWEWLKQAERDHKADTVPLVVFRKNNEDWQVALNFEAFLELLRSNKDG